MEKHVPEARGGPVTLTGLSTEVDGKVCLRLVPLMQSQQVQQVTSHETRSIRLVNMNTRSSSIEKAESASCSEDAA